MGNFELMKRRLEAQGGIKQEDRMIKDKYNTFLHSLKYSYQAADVEMVQRWDQCLEAYPAAPDPTGTPVEPPVPARALINPNKLKQDYDDKILSIDSKYNWGPGDVFRWAGTDSYWIIYLEELTEDAYFRGDIRRCKYKIKFKDQEGKWFATWAAIRGPVETQIDSIQKNQVRVDRPNLSLNILLPRNPQTIYAFDRYKEFLFAGRDWQVKAPDTISMTNVIEIAAEEHYIDKDRDDVEQNMKNGLVIEPYDPTPAVLSRIHGEGFIKPKITETYSVDEEGGVWRVANNVPVSIEVVDSKTIHLTWCKATHGQFELQWVKDNTILKRTIVVESLF